MPCPCLELGDPAPDVASPADIACSDLKLLYPALDTACSALDIPSPALYTAC